MLALEITGLYTAILAIIFAWLSLRVSLMRKSRGIPIFHGNDFELRRAIRTHGNFMEYVPLLLIMLAILELNDFDERRLHIYGIAIVFFRVVHVLGFGYIETFEKNLKKCRRSAMRFMGALFTYILLVVMAATIVWQIYF